MRIKRHFRNETTSDFSNISIFALKSAWNPTKGHPNLEVLLNLVESDLFKATERPLVYCSLTRDEWQSIRSLADDKNIVTKITDKGPCVVIWDRHYYFNEG